ncbi:hypothetical protein AB0L40_15120 [Patulibacter sp. NPDC049589]|uniref:hypothetical protein n=1 Tax=Patulibacter sp. NPDC049589 TaxID=3154731 RepID=UPI00343E4687
MAIRSRIEGRSWSATQGDSSFSNDEQGWVRVTGDGDPLDVRSVRLRSSDASGPGSAPPGLEETTAYPRPGQETITQRQYDPRTGRTTTERGAGEVPRLVFRAHDLLQEARRGAADVRLDGERTIDGRRTYRLVVRDPADGAPIPGIEDRTELYVDAETYAAVEYRHVSQGRTQPGGVPFRSELVQRVLDYEELPDTAGNRELLELRGPREPARPQP